MLPFQKPKMIAGLIIQKRKPDAQKPLESKEDSESGDSGMHACAEDILRAIAQKDPMHLAQALQAAYDIMESDEKDSEPEESEDNSYDAQNAKAAKGNE